MKKPTIYAAFTNGLCDRREGVPMNANPFPVQQMRLRAAWEDGWLTENRFLAANPHITLKSGEVKQ
jgi:hypothetical protein